MIIHQRHCKRLYIGAALLLAACIILFAWQPAKAAAPKTNLCPRSTQPPLPSSVPTAWSNFNNPGFITDYTYLGLPIADTETSSDPTNGGAAVQPESIDLASGSPNGDPGQYTTPFYGYYDGGTLYDPDDPDSMLDDFVLFRMRLEADPSAKDGFSSRHWNILVDVDADGYKEYWVDIDGSLTSNKGPDILQVLYNNDNNQLVTDPDASRVYSFDAYNDGSNSDSFTRSYPAPDGMEGDYWLEAQIPLWAFLDIDPSGSSGCVQQVTPDSPVGFVFSTSTSKTDPLQKDWMMDLDFISHADPITFGDIVTISGEPRLYFADSNLQEVFFYTAAVDEFTPGDDIYTFVKYVPGNTDSNEIETMTVTVTNPRTGDDEQLTLVESTPSSGLFTNRGGADKPDTTNSPDGWISSGVTTSPSTDNASWSVEYNGEVWEVYKNSLLQSGTVTPGTEYTSPGGEISFTLYETDPTNGDTIIFDTYEAISLSSVIDNLSLNDSDNSGSLESTSGDTILFSYNTGSRNYTTAVEIVGEGEPYIQFTRANGMPSNDFQLTDDINTSDKLYITVTHPESNSDPNTAETIYVSLAGNDNIYYNPGPGLELTETGPNTGIFRNTTGLDTQIDDGSVNFNDTIWEDVDGGTITATFNYQGTNYSTPSTLFYINYGGRVSFTNISGTIDVDSYTAGEDIFIRLDETFSATDCGNNDPIMVTVTSESGDSETIDLYETPSDSASYMNFPGTLSTAAGTVNPGNGILEANHEEILTVSYTDCNDGDPDPANDIKTDLAVLNSPSILINEVFFFPNTDPLEGQTEFFQIYNSSSSAVNIFGYTVTDEDDFTYTFPLEPQGSVADQFLLPSGAVAYVFLYDGDFSSVNFYDSDTNTYYLYTNGSAFPSDQFGDPDDPNDDPAKPDENKADQLTLRDSFDTIVDYVGWSFTTQPSVDFQGDDSPAVIQDVWQDDAYKAVYDDPATTLVDEDIQPGFAITRVSLGFDTDKPSDWIYKDVTNLWDPDSPLITQAIISSFDAYLDNGQVMVRWTTASEIGTLGFYLYRRDRKKFNYELVNKDLLPGLITSPQGGTYTYVDADADPDKNYEYLLEEVEFNSKRNEYGPYKVKMSGPGYNPATTAANEARPSLRKSKETKYSRRAHLGPAAANTLISTQDIKENNKRPGSDREKSSEQKYPPSNNEVDALKITVLESGLYKLDTTEIAEQFGLSINDVKKRIAHSNLKLTNMGHMVAYQPMKDKEGIYFYGQKLDSMYTAENIYWLTLDEGRMMRKLKLSKKQRHLPADLSFTHTLHIEEDSIPLLSQPMDTSEDYWIWNYIFSGWEGWDFLEFPFEIDALDTSADTANISIHFVGGSMEGAGNDHHAEIFVNDLPVINENCSWKGIKPETCTFSIPSSLLKEGQNTLRINGILENDVGFSLFYVDSFELNYERYYQAKENSLFFPGENIRTLAVHGFDTAEIFIIDITRPDIPLFATKMGFRESNGYTLKFTRSQNSGKLFTVSATAAKSVTSIQPYNSTGLYLKNEIADYLVITPADLQITAQNLADYRSSQGYAVKVVLLDNIIDEFNFGLASPEAIRKYLSFTYNYWRNTPGYVVLIGDGSYDYKDIEGYGGNLMPPLMVSTPAGVFASDNALADVTGNGMPDMAIGRIPASSPEELQSVIDKIIQYESNTGTWKKKALLLADKQSAGSYDFEFNSNWIGSLIPEYYTLDKIHLSETDLDTARQQLINGLNSGVALTNFFGHAGLDRLAPVGWLTALLLSTDVDALKSPQGSPVITAMTCAFGQFSFAPYDTLAEKLVVKENGGATAVWSSSGLSENSQARLLDAEFYRALFEKNEDILGDAILEALKEYAKVGVEPYHISIYNLLGDPALRMK